MQHQHQPQPAFAWQSILSVFSLAGNGKALAEGEDGLGVDDDTLCPYAWAKPIHQLNCDIVFPKELDEPSKSLFGNDDALMAFRRKKTHYFELYTPDYAGLIKERWIVEKLLTQAGVRLAAVLNWIFAEVDDNETRRRYISL